MQLDELKKLLLAGRPEFWAELAGVGLRIICISPPASVLLFGGRRVSFYNVVGMGLIEIIE